jgi:nitronate monooxygenase
MSRADALRRLLGVDIPLIQAPMAGIQDSVLAIAASNAGALGSLPCALLDVNGIANQVAALRTATDRPFNVNFFCHEPPPVDAAREAAWRALLAPYYRELGLDVAPVPPGPGRAPFTAEAADVLADFRPAVVSFHFGLPAPPLLDRVRSWGSKILATATSLFEARRLERRGVDAVVLQGREAGGHRGAFLGNDAAPLGTFELLRAVAGRLSVPAIAAGGIVDARGVAAAFAAGASGVQLGTAFLLCPEATTSAVHRAAVKSEASLHTAFTNLFTGRPARGIVNRLMRELGPMSAAVPAFPLATAAIAPLRAAAEAQGRGDFSPLWCGENATGCREVPAGELIRALAQDL